MEYVLTSFNIVSQVIVPAVQGLEDALSHAADLVTGSFQRVIPNPSIPTYIPEEYRAAFLFIGLVVLVVGYLTFRRA